MGISLDLAILPCFQFHSYLISTVSFVIILSPYTSTNLNSFIQIYEKKKGVVCFEFIVIMGKREKYLYESEISKFMNKSNGEVQESDFSNINGSEFDYIEDMEIDYLNNHVFQM